MGSFYIALRRTTAGHRGAGLAIRHSSGRAGKRHVAAARDRRPAGERHGTAGHRGAGLAIHRGHSPARAGKRHIAAARADAGRPGSVCLDAELSFYAVEVFRIGLTF
jgi:hypothetical protein